MRYRVVMRGGSGYRLGALCAFAFACVIALGQDQPFNPREVRIAYEPALQSDEGESFGSMVPIRVQITNPLNNDQGVVTVISGSYRMLYPIELPAKSTRSFIVYFPTNQSFGDQYLELACRQGYSKLQIQTGSDYGQTLDYGLISDTMALMRFVRASQIEDTNSTDDYRETMIQRDFAAKPGSAPDRAIGYEGLDLLILGEGAERMTDAEVSATQRYVLSGGTLLITGGAVSPILRDERWAAYLPGTNPRVVNVQGSRVLSSLTGEPMSETLTLTQLTPSPGTTGLKENGIPLLWYKRCGLGTVAYWAFDPFFDPIRTYRGRGKLFSDTAMATGQEPANYKLELGVQQPTNDEYYYMGGYSPYYEEQNTNSVFTVSMPSTTRIFIILGLYFVVVVPVNFLVLHKLKRGQLAWITSPVIGLAFASIFFYVARDLYATNMSRSTTALLVAHEGATDAYVVGKQQLFFPTGGRYDLGLHGVEAVSSTSNPNYYGPAIETGFTGDLIDEGEVVAPRAGVSNLAFREFSFNQHVPWNYKLPLKLEVARENGVERVTGSLTNDTPYVLTSISLWVEGKEIIIGQIKSGETRQIDDKSAVLPTTTRNPSSPPPGKGLVALTAKPLGLEVGTNLGEELGGGTKIYYTYDSIDLGAR